MAVNELRKATRAIAYLFQVSLARWCMGRGTGEFCSSHSSHHRAIVQLPEGQRLALYSNVSLDVDDVLKPFDGPPGSMPPRVITVSSSRPFFPLPLLDLPRSIPPPCTHVYFTVSALCFCVSALSASLYLL
jgi:hypothetical protein